MISPPAAPPLLGGGAELDAAAVSEEPVSDEPADEVAGAALPVSELGAALVAAELLGAAVVGAAELLGLLVAVELDEPQAAVASSDTVIATPNNRRLAG